MPEKTLSPGETKKIHTANHRRESLFIRVDGGTVRVAKSQPFAHLGRELEDDRGDLVFTERGEPVYVHAPGSNSGDVTVHFESQGFFLNYAPRKTVRTTLENVDVANVPIEIVAASATVGMNFEGQTQNVSMDVADQTIDNVEVARLGDQAALSGSLDSSEANGTMNSGDFALGTLHTNNSGAEQFMETLTFGQEGGAGDYTNNVEIDFQIDDSGGNKLFGFSANPLHFPFHFDPAPPIPDGGEVTYSLENFNSSSVNWEMHVLYWG